MVNIFSGRGRFYNFENSSELAATILFSPRLFVSRWQMLGLQPLYHGSMATRYLVCKEYIRMALGVGAALGLGAMAGGKIETDPTSSDFLKLRFGNHARLDVLFGATPALVLLARTIFGHAKNISGETFPTRGVDVPYGKPDWWRLVADHMRGKLAPVTGEAVNMLAGNYPYAASLQERAWTPARAVRNLTVPLSPGQFADEIVKISKEEGVPAATVLEVLQFMGMGLQYYDR
jgi:hypothetical protein